MLLLRPRQNVNRMIGRENDRHLVGGSVVDLTRQPLRVSRRRERQIMHVQIEAVGVDIAPDFGIRTR